MNKGSPCILVRGTDWIGDAVMSVPALKEMRRLHPDSRIVLLVRNWVAGVYQGQGFADEIVALPDNSSAFSEFLQSRSRMRGADVAVLFKNSFSAALSAWSASVPQRLGYQRDGRGVLLTQRAASRSRRQGLHQVFDYLDLIYQTGLSPIDYLSADFQPDIRLQVPREGLREAHSLLAEIGLRPDRVRVVLHPGAHFGSAKRWFSSRYAQVSDMLVEEFGAEVLIVGSAGERVVARQVAGAMKARAHILSGKTTLTGLMGLLAESDLFLTNDSGPMHLAAALDVPQVALFGSTDDEATGPLSRRSVVLHKHVECSPCLLRECPIDLRCFSAIRAGDVMAAARELLSSAKSVIQSPGPSTAVPATGTTTPED